MENQNCQNCKKDFIIEPEDFNFYEKMKVPPPTFCPECRMIRRFNYRNESMLFKRPDALTGKEIFSGISPEADILTYENKYWYGDEWDKLATGRDYDFNRPFFEQFKELLSSAPLPAKSVYNVVNSDYCNEMSETKNSYLCFNSDYLENSAYIRKMTHCKECFDLYEGTENELCYDSLLIDRSYRTFYSMDCENCVDVWFSRGMRGCSNCFGCSNLSGQSYHFFNQPLSKEEYKQKVDEFLTGSFEKIKEAKKKSRDFWAKFPVKYNHNVRITNSTGERIFDSKNVKKSYSVRNGENLKYCQDIQPKASNSYDYFVWGPGENVYEAVTVGAGAYNVKFSFNCWDEISDLEYCAYCLNSKNCFGCVGLYKKEYCIFNKQYSKEDYEMLRSKIIEQMSTLPYTDKKGRKFSYGEFFPFEISPIAYNEGSAQEFYPLTKDEAENKGYIWRDISKKEYQTTLDAKDLPDNIGEVKEGILEESIKCENCARAYRITNMEFQFYRRISLPLPRICSNCRFLERFKMVNPPKLWQRSCMCEKEHQNHTGKCSEEFETSYAPDRPEIVYCEKCYQQEVY